MISELDIAGVFVSPLLLCMLVALVLRVALSRGLDALGLYRVVWHRPLFDISLYFILLGLSFEGLKYFTKI